MLLCPAECLACKLDITDCMQNVTTDLLLTHLSRLKETDLAMTEYLEERITRRAGRSMQGQGAKITTRCLRIGSEGM